MIVNMSRWALLAVVGLRCLQAQVQVPTGAEFPIRLESSISSNESKSGAPVTAVVIAPLMVGNTVAIPSGCKVSGKITDAHPSLKPDERASLLVAFSSLECESTKDEITARVVQVDNAREQVDPSGRILGILASETLSSKLEKGIGKVAERNSRLGDLLAVAQTTILQNKASGEIKYPAGVEMKLRILKSFKSKGYAPVPLSPINDEKELYSLINRQPFRTRAENPPKPSDLTNLMFIGSEEQLLEAFRLAGWSQTHSLNQASVLETIRAVADLRGYKEAPMSVLLLDDKRSDFDLQKGNNTFAKRHHLRVWRRPETFTDKPVWVSSSTHDIAIEFSEQNATFIHSIDPDIDRERAKVVSDLLFTGKVQSLALVDRPEIPKDAMNATGDRLITDGKQAVMIFK
jgi:hypothetical protein